MYDSPTGVIVSGSKTGWMTTELFPSMLQHIKKPVKTRKSDTILLITDIHNTHISLKAFNYCREWYCASKTATTLMRHATA